MTMENSGHDGTKPADGNAQPPVTGNVPNPSRRRFNRAGVGASAVVMTLASRSVLADTLCKSPSGYDSIAPSITAGSTSNSCTGVGPSGWLQRRDWPVDKDALFLTSFGTASPGQYAIAPSLATGTGANANPNGVLLKDATLLQALQGSETPTVVKNLIAAWFNALKGFNTFPTADQVIHIYQEWQLKNYYEVRAGVQWTDAKINEYLAAMRSAG